MAWHVEFQSCEDDRPVKCGLDDAAIADLLAFADLGDNLGLQLVFVAASLPLRSGNDERRALTVRNPRCSSEAIPRSRTQIRSVRPHLVALRRTQECLRKPR